MAVYSLYLTYSTGYPFAYLRVSKFFPEGTLLYFVIVYSGFHFYAEEKNYGLEWNFVEVDHYKIFIVVWLPYSFSFYHSPDFFSY